METRLIQVDVATSREWVWEECSPDPGLSGVVLPSTLRADDRMTKALQGQAVIAVPPARTLSTFLGGNKGWARTTVDAPGTTLGPVRIPESLAKSPARWVVADIDQVARTGPFVLDVVARYLHPRDRARLLIQDARADLAAEANLAAPVDGAVIGAQHGYGYVLALTTDLIAAELFALACAEPLLSNARSWQGPWEDRVVQRATELQLGVSLPDEIEVRVRLWPGVDAAEAQKALIRMCGRFGVQPDFM